MGIFSGPEFQLAIVEVEVFLALWLLWGVQPIGSWVLALMVFIGFAGASFYQVWIGQASCGCFGQLSVHPWYAFGLDVLVLAALVAIRPDFSPLRARSRSDWWQTAKSGIRGVACLALVSLFLGVLAHVTFGSVMAAVAHFRGERLSIQPRLLDLGEGAASEMRTVTLAVSNWTDAPIRLIGGTSDCSCTVLNDLPVTIPAKDTRSLAISVRLPGQPGIFTRTASFLVDDAGRSKNIGFQLTGRVRKGHGGEVVGSDH